VAKSKRKKPEVRKQSGEPLEAQRNPDGTFAPGVSGCPGGRGLSISRFARLVRESTEDGRALVTEALGIAKRETKFVEYVGKEATPVEVGPSPRDVMDAVKWLREVGWGKSLPASQMLLPEELAMPATGEPSTVGHIAQAQRTLSVALAQAEAQMAAGLPLSSESGAALSAAVGVLATLAREERELSKQGVGAGLADAELVAAVLASLPAEKLREALAAKEAA
jgi:hypothetical protein